MKDRAEGRINAGSQLAASSMKMNEIRKELKSFRRAAVNYQNTLRNGTMKVNGKDILNIRNDQAEGLSVLNRLIVLPEKAERGYVKPADPNERFAAMIMAKDAVQDNLPERNICWIILLSRIR